VRERGHLRPPDALRSAAYPGARKLGRGQGYLYPHDDPHGFEVDCLPDELAGTVYYEPSGNGGEVEVERSATAEPKPELD
jgi:putative ATPase